MLKKISATALTILVLGVIATAVQSPESPVPQPQSEWISLFDGQTLDGWKVGNHPKTFSVQDGKIVVHGKRAHLFYTGPVQNHDFENFEFKADVMTTKGSNSGIYFLTQYQEAGWPSKGYEAQVNNSYNKDPRRTGSLYGINDIKKTVVSDNTWFTMRIKVEERHITISVDDQKLVDYMQPKDATQKERFLESGTFALQGHDPDSKVYYKNIKVRPL